MKYLKLFEQFEEGHKFDILDLYLMDSSYVKPMFFKEIQKLNYDLESIQTILDSGLVNIDDTDYWGNTALIYATKSYNLELIKFLISNGANPNASNSIDLLSPLHEAAYSGFVKAVQFLISSGANPNVKDRKQWTPLHLAAQRTDKNHMEIVEILIESGADLYAKTTSNITPLDLVNSEEMQNVFEKYKKKEAHSQI